MAMEGHSRRKKNPSDESTASGDSAYCSGPLLPWGLGLETWQTEFYTGIPGLVCLARSSHQLPERPYTTHGPASVYLFAIGHHPIVDRYDTIRNNIRDCCLGLDWVAIGVYRWGWERRSPFANPVTVFIYVRHSGTTVRHAAEVVACVEHILQSANFPDIHIHVAGQARALDEGNEDVLDFPSTYTEQPTVGRSIGPSTAHNMSGTLAFYGKICAEGCLIKYFGVTCHHVAFPRTRPAVAGDMRAPCEHGFKDASNMMTIDGPSLKDHNLFIQNSCECVALERTEIRQLIECDELSKQGAARPLTKYQHEALIATEESVQRIEAELQAVKDFPRLMGTVRCSSGLHRYSPGGGIMDWALFELDQARFTEADKLNNCLPECTIRTLHGYCKAVRGDVPSWATILEESRERAYGKILSADEIPHLMQTYNTNTIPPTYTIPETGMSIVALYGRTSGATIGCLNEIRDDVRTIYLTQSGPVEVITTEVVVLDAIPLSLYSKVPTFSKSGDSGAPIFDLRGRMVGMLIGGNSDDRSGYPASWLTPVEWILDDIQKTVRAHLGTVNVCFL